MEQNQFLAVFIDGAYKQILIIQADNLEDAEKKLFDKGWEYPVRIDKVKFKDDVAIIFDGT